MLSVVQDVVCMVRTMQSSRPRQAGRSAGSDSEEVLLRSPDAEGACRAPELHRINPRVQTQTPGVLHFQSAKDGRFCDRFFIGSDKRSLSRRQRTVGFEPTEGPERRSCSPQP